MAGAKKRIGALSKRVAKQLGINGIFTDLSAELEKHLATAAEYCDFRRVENERQLERLKAVLGGYVFKAKPDFDELCRASNLYLSAMNMQNKMWGLYAVPEEANGDPTGNALRAVTVKMVQEMQKIAKARHLPLPAIMDVSSESRTVDKGAPAPDAGRAVPS